MMLGFPRQWAKESVVPSVGILRLYKTSGSHGWRRNTHAVFEAPC